MFWDQDLDGREAALVQRDVLRDEAAEAVDDGGVSDGFRGVGVGVDFGPGAGEVEGCGAGLRGDGDAERDGRAVVHVVCCCQGGGEAAGDGAEEAPDGGLGVGLDSAHVEVDDGESVFAD